jgi:hypothetical protein
MKSSRNTFIFIATGLTLLAAFGTLAQNQNGTRSGFGHSTDEWMPPQSSNIPELYYQSDQGRVSVQSFWTQQPYLDTLQFYAKKCDQTGPPGMIAHRLANAAKYENGRSVYLYPLSSFLAVNRLHVLTSTFVRLYPHYTVTIDLFHDEQQNSTEVTVTRADLPSQKL